MQQRSARDPLAGCSADRLPNLFGPRSRFTPRIPTPQASQPPVPVNMNSRNGLRPTPHLTWLLAGLLPVSAAAQATAPAQDETAETEETVTLSPFEVNSSRDKGYRATNSISGSRIDTPIKDIPMPIEVITGQFVRDVGASDLRQSLRYSAGIILQSQNDQSVNAFYGPGGVNNPEGATANKTQSTIKIRGYLTDVVLRDGYRRQSSTDAVNISRIEVIRGPAALLYGIGNFGGIVNYLPDTPELEPHTWASVSYGSHDFMRATIDNTGPLGQRWGAAYRINAAVEKTGNHTELYEQDHWFVAPAISFNLTPKTKVLFDYEQGRMDETGIGFLSVRARAADFDGAAQADRLQSAGFVQFAGKDPRTFRWSGPDTFRETEQKNFRAQVTHEMAPNLNLLAGFNTSDVEFTTRDVNGSMQQNEGPAALRDTIYVLPIDVANGSNEAGFQMGPTPNTIFRYTWADTFEDNNRDQVRAELNYKFDLFENANRWLKIGSSLLVGRSYEKANRKSFLTATRNLAYNYKRPTDTSYIRFGTQGDGTADAPMVAYNKIVTNGWNRGDYGVYQGKFLNDRVTAIAGIRRDKNDYDVDTLIFHPTASHTYARRPTQKDNTEQYGVTLEIVPQLSVYALKSGGLQPNFDGLRDATGNPLGPVEAKSEEVGLKIDLWDGRISGTISSFKIVRKGVPFGQWWMPTLKGTFKAGQPIVYNVNNFSPSTVPGGSNGGNGAANAALNEWNAGVAAGAIYQQNVNGQPNWYVNASTPQGAAYLDRVFTLTKTTHPGWPGWLYINDVNTNNGWEDRGDGNGWQAYVQQEDESKGWDAQILFTPTENLQFIATYAHVKRVITNPGKFIKYPHPENRWAVWYFPDGNWGLTGYDLEEVYTDPADTSTWTGIGWGAGQSRDDTPKHAATGWAHYRFTSGPLKGLSLGLGAQWESEREYFSGVTVAGQKQTNSKGELIVLKHKARLNIDAMVKYDFKVRGYNTYAQVNVYNLEDDTDLYGLIYAPGRTIRLEVGMDF
jgi:iron complex outermembrane recepter protein